MVYHKAASARARLKPVHFYRFASVKFSSHRASMRVASAFSYKFNRERCDPCEGKSRCYEKVKLTMDAAHYRSRLATLSHRIPASSQLRSCLLQSCFRTNVRGEAP